MHAASRPSFAGLGCRAPWRKGIEGEPKRAAGVAGIVGGVGLAIVPVMYNAVGLNPETAEPWFFLPAPLGFAPMVLAALVLGIALLFRRSVPWVAPALMVATVPAAVVTVLLDALAGVSLTAAAVEVPLYLAFAVLGYELLGDHWVSAAICSSRLARFQRRSMKTASQIDSS